MIKWIIRKLGQLSKWGSDAATAVEQAESKFSAWNLVDFGAGVAVGVVVGKVLL